METVNVPGVGPVQKKYLIVAGIGIAGYVGYKFISRAKSQAPATDLIDPATGLPYATEGLTSDGYKNPNPQSTIDTTGGAITTNTAWVSDVTEKLSNIGMEPGFIAATLGKYLAGQALTSDEANLVRTAWAYAGKPPEGPSNFTLATGGGSTPGGGDTPTNTPVYADVKAGWLVDQWVADLNSGFGSGTAGKGYTKESIFALNPGIEGNTRSDPHGLVFDHSGHYRIS